MNDLSVILSKLRKKEMEIQSLEEKLRATRIYVHALKEVLAALKGDTNTAHTEQDSLTLRPGSALASAREAILNVGRPMHIDELLRAAGKEPTRDTKVSLSSSLSSYVRRNEIFTRPAMNTFGLVELGHFAKSKTIQRVEPPPGFGRVGGGLPVRTDE